jgi:hypothetical protein
MIVGPFKLDLGKHRLQSFVPITHKLGLMALSTFDSAPSIISLVAIQHTFEQPPAKLMHAGADGALTRFQIHSSPLVPCF